MNIALSDFTVTNTMDFSKILTTIKEYGVAVLPHWLSKESLINLDNDWHAMREVRNDPSVECVLRVGGDVADYAALYRSIKGSKRFKYANQVFDDPLLVKLVNKIIGNPSLFNEEIYATYDIGKGEEVAPSHFDKTWNIKFMIYLDDILEPGFGAFGIHPASQTLARHKFRSWFDTLCKNDFIEIGTPEFYKMGNELIDCDDIKETINDCVEIYAPAGSLIIFSTDVFHRGGFLKEGLERRIMRAHSYPGYRLPRTGDKLRKSSRQWVRGEQWELHDKSYSRFSKGGLLEWIDR
ncbi:hypothetical protein [Legionella sp. W05-934-2]|uniref:hypothetical protein n=1 Tax=Legionella sp. W05-934-2 TaxID=1198649 RepID=UPI0034626996